MIALLIWKRKGHLKQQKHGDAGIYSQRTLQVTQVDSVHDITGRQVREIFCEDIGHKADIDRRGRGSELAATRVHPHRSRRWGAPGASCGCGPARTAPPSRSAGRG